MGATPQHPSPLCHGRWTLSFRYMRRRTPNPNAPTPILVIFLPIRSFLTRNPDTPEKMDIQVIETRTFRKVRQDFWRCKANALSLCQTLVSSYRLCHSNTYESLMYKFVFRIVDTFSGKCYTPSQSPPFEFSYVRSLSSSGGLFRSHVT